MFSYVTNNARYVNVILRYFNIVKRNSILYDRTKFGSEYESKFKQFKFQTIQISVCAYRSGSNWVACEWIAWYIIVSRSGICRGTQWKYLRGISAKTGGLKLPNSAVFPQARNTDTACLTDCVVFRHCKLKWNMRKNRLNLLVTPYHHTVWFNQCDFDDFWIRHFLQIDFSSPRTVGIAGKRFWGRPCMSSWRATVVTNQGSKPLL